MDRLAKIMASKDFDAITSMIDYVRSKAPYLVPTKDIAMALGRHKRQVYGLVKLARQWLSQTDEIMPNERKVGYTVTTVKKSPRAALFESIKSGNRADGHLAQEGEMFDRVDRIQLKSAEDEALYVAQQGRKRLGEARLAMSRDMNDLMKRHKGNRLLISTAHENAKTPWDVLGLDDPSDNN